MDQGAIQALPILSALTRRDAGLAEVAIAGTMADKTAWQKLVAGDASPVDLLEARSELKQGGVELPQAVSWLEVSDVAQFRYPILDYPTTIKQLRAGKDVAVMGTLLGVKGQYLLMSNGVFNVRRFSGFHVSVSFQDPQEDQPWNRSAGSVLTTGRTAAVRDGEPKTIRLSDYSAPVMQIREVDLTVDITPGSTTVSSRLSIARNTPG